MPRLSARLKAGLGSDVTDLMLEGDNVVGHRAQYAGKVFCDVTVSSAVKLFTVRQDFHSTARTRFRKRRS